MITIKTQGEIEQYFNPESNRYEFHDSVSFEWSVITKAGIWSSGSIEAGWYIFSFNFSIKCKFIVTKTIPFWRAYYADMPPLKKWGDKILDNSMCWDDFRSMLSDQYVVNVESPEVK